MILKTVRGTIITVSSIPGWLVIGVLSAVSIPLDASSSSYGPLTLQDFQTKAAFELVVTNSNALKAGTSRIAAQSAYVTLAHGLVPGNADGLEIHFFPTQPTEKVKADILENDAKELKKSSYAALVLFLGKDNKIWQANLSFVVAGTTAARTVAWKPEELKKYFSVYQFDGNRLLLKSNGNYVEAEKDREQLRLSWNVDLNLSVVREVRR
ncbi:MAG TPA: hypothetical protein VF452_08495 [Candidatus Binatia bacterium]